MKKCCFIGHREIVVTEKLKNEIKKYLIKLIENENVSIFLFGSKSDFDKLCHEIVTELMQDYSITRLMYTCQSESATLEKDRVSLEQVYNEVAKGKVHIMGFEGEIEHKTKCLSNKASYIERNYAMINDSDYCIFYYNKDYLPKKRKHNKNDLIYYQPNSGTALAFKYAKQKNKQIVNFYK